MILSGGLDFDVCYGEVCIDIDVGSISLWLTEEDLVKMLEELRKSEVIL